MKKILYSLIIGLILSPLAEAQERQKEFIYEWNDFSKGLNTKSSSLGLDKQYGTTCQNIDLSEEHKSISKRSEIFSYGTMDTSEATKGLHRLYLKDGSKILLGAHGDEIEKGSDTTGTFTSILDLATADYRWSWVTWHDLAIGCDGYNSPIKTDGTDATYLGTCYAEALTTGGGPNGTYKYKVTYCTSAYEVRFDVASNLVTVANKDVALSMIPIGPDTYGGENVTGRNVYRSDTGGAGTYNLLSNGAIANNTSTTLTDTDTDEECDAGTAYSTFDDTYTPPKGKYAVIHKNRLWFANDPTTATDTGPSTTYYSEDGSHDVFVDDSYFNIRKNDGDGITFVKNLLGILTIGKESTIQKLYTRGADPANDWEISDPFSFTGCTAPYSAANTPLGIFYLNWDGLYNFNGQYSKLVSDIITPTIKDISLSNFKYAWGEFYDNKYYLAYASKEASDNDRCLKYDLLTNAYSIDIIDINCFTVFGGGTDRGELYAGSSTDGKVYTYVEDSTLEVSHGAHVDFAGTWDDMRYIPPVAGGDAAEAVLELAWDITIDEMTGTIDAYVGQVNIDRPDNEGTYISEVLETPGVSAYNTLEWHETLPTVPSDKDVYFQLRGSTTEALCKAASWDSTQYSIPSGSNISGEIGGTAYAYTQYRITMESSDPDYTPTVYYDYGFTTKMSYDILASVMESSIDLEWESGWDSLGIPSAYEKTLRKLYCWHEGASGSLILTFTTEEGITDSFTIDLSTNPSYYITYFTEGGLTGRYVKLNITHTGMYPVKVKKVLIVGDVEPIV